MKKYFSGKRMIRQLQEKAAEFCQLEKPSILLEREGMGYYRAFVRHKA
jgi:hypothetical protein